MNRVSHALDKLRSEPVRAPSVRHDPDLAGEEHDVIRVPPGVSVGRRPRIADLPEMFNAIQYLIGSDVIDVPSRPVLPSHPVVLHCFCARQKEVWDHLTDVPDSPFCASVEGRNRRRRKLTVRRRSQRKVAVLRDMMPERSQWLEVPCTAFIRTFQVLHVSVQTNPQPGPEDIIPGIVRGSAHATTFRR